MAIKIELPNFQRQTLKVGLKIVGILDWSAGQHVFNSIWCRCYSPITGNTLTFRRANIVALNEDYPFPEDADSTFEMEVAAPAVVPPVRAVLFGSSTISSCGIIKVFLQSQGAAGRELTNDWSVTSEGDTSQVGDALQCKSIF